MQVGASRLLVSDFGFSLLVLRVVALEEGGGLGEGPLEVDVADLGAPPSPAAWRRSELRLEIRAFRHGFSGLAARDGRTVG